VALSKIKIKAMIEQGNRKAIAINRILERPEDFFGTILIVNNLVTILAGSIATVIAMTLFDKGGILIATILVTLIITLADILAKTYSVRNPEFVSYWIVRPYQFLMFVLTPFIKILSWTTRNIMRLFGDKKVLVPFVTREELKTLIKIGGKEGILHEKEMDMVYKIFNFTEKRAKDVMIEMDKVFMCDIDLPIEEILEQISMVGYKRVPLYKDSKDNIVGIAYTKDLLAMWTNQQLLILEDCLSEPYFIEEDMKIIDLMQQFQTSQMHMAIVKNKKGKIVGLVCLDDLFEEIVGEIVSEHINYAFLKKQAQK
jgi:CBS domain containing-hemolysin-like protein